MIQLNLTIEKVTNRSRDKSIVFTASSQSLPPHEMTVLFGYLDRHCRALIRDVEIEQADIYLLENYEPNPDDFESQKSPSQRMRNIIWQIWDKNFRNQYEDLNRYYEFKMNRISETLKEQIER